MTVKKSKGLFAAVLSKLDEEEQVAKAAQANSQAASKLEDGANLTHNDSLPVDDAASPNPISPDVPNHNTEASQASSLSKAYVARSHSPHLLKLADGVKQIQEKSQLAEQLLRSGMQIIDIDPLKVHPSPINDRLDSADDANELAEIIASMRERGQIVPGLVRPISGKSDEFEIVYGRRRLLAAKHLGLSFKAAIRSLSDEEAIIFQGEENNARKDLSFIEKCLFAKAQEDAGFKRETICASLATGKSHVSEMIKLANALPAALLALIGKAKGIGRGRFETLLKRLNGLTLSEQEAQLADFARDASFHALSSEEKFNRLFAHFSKKNQQSHHHPKHDASALRDKSTQDANFNPTLAPHAPLNDYQLKWQSADRLISLAFDKDHAKATLSLAGPCLDGQADNQNHTPTPLAEPASPLASAAQRAQQDQPAYADMVHFIEFLASKLDGLYTAYQQAANSDNKDAKE